MDILANNKLNRLVARTSEPLAFTIDDALVMPWTPFKLIYAFPLMKILLRLLRKIGLERVLATFILRLQGESCHHLQSPV